MTLVLGGWLITSALEDPRPRAGARIVDDRVDTVATNDRLRTEFPDDPVVDAAGHVVMPGLVNTRLHMYGVLAHGIPLDAAPTGFWSFLHDFWWPRVEDALDYDMIPAAMEWACLELARTGTTTFLDILEAPNAVDDGLFVEKEIVGRSDIGRLEPGWKADLLAIDGSFPSPATRHNLAEQIVLYRSGRDVRDVMVDGRCRVRGGEVLGADSEAIRARVGEQAERLWTV